MPRKREEIKFVKGDSHYKQVTQYMIKKKVYTRSELVSYCMFTLGKTEEQARYTVKTLLSPRFKSDRGDCRGSTSNPWGHLAYNEKLPRKHVGEKKEEQRFRFRYRRHALPPRLYSYQKKRIQQEKQDHNATTHMVRAKGKAVIVHD